MYLRCVCIKHLRSPLAFRGSFHAFVPVLAMRLHLNHYSKLLGSERERKRIHNANANACKEPLH